MYSCRHIPVWLLSLARRRALQQRAESISGMSADDESNSNRKQKLTSVMFSGTKYADINYHIMAMFVLMESVVSE